MFVVYRKDTGIPEEQRQYLERVVKLLLGWEIQAAAW